MYTTGELLRDAMDDMGRLIYGTVTGGSTATVEDTTVAHRRPQNYKGGGIIITRAGGVAPEGEFVKIDNYSSNIFTLATPLTATAAAGQTYAAWQNGTISFEGLLSLLNMALGRFHIPASDESIVSAGTTHVLPAGVKGNAIYAIRYLHSGIWNSLRNWRVQPTDTGTDGLLLTPYVPVGATIQLWYRSSHPKVWAWNDPISEYVHPVLARAAVKEAFRGRDADSAQGSAGPFNRSYDKAASELDQARILYPILYPYNRARVL